MARTKKGAQKRSKKEPKSQAQPEEEEKEEVPIVVPTEPEINNKFLINPKDKGKRVDLKKLKTNVNKVVDEHGQVFLIHT